MLLGLDGRGHILQRWIKLLGILYHYEELIHLESCTKLFISKFMLIVLVIDSCSVDPATSLWNLGIFIDCDLSMGTHVTRTLSRCFAALRQLRQIFDARCLRPRSRLWWSRWYIPRLDYPNTVLAGLPAYLQRCLQSMLNAVARLLVFYMISDSVTISPTLSSASTGCMFRSVSSSSWLCWLTNFCSIKHRVTLDLSSVSPTCLAGEQSVLPTLTVCWCRRSDCHLSAVEPLRSLHLVHGTICQTLLHLLTHYTLSGATSRLIFSSILSGHHCDTRVDLAIASSIWATIKQIRLD